MPKPKKPEKNAALRAHFNPKFKHWEIKDPPESPTPPVEKIRTFVNDWRVKNPALHNYHVRGAYEDLKIIEEAARTLEARARVPCSAVAAALRQAMREEIEQDAAFFEAAALLFAGLELPKAEVE